MGFFKNLFSTKTEKETEKVDNEPRIEVVKIHIPNPNNPTNGYFELDWNDAFVVKLRENGYTGKSDEEVVEQWFNDLCRGIISENEFK
jgi:hypothetical protein